MTAKGFRRIALSLPETEERAHMDHPDFRVAGKIFATLGYPDKTSGMVKLSPEDQHNFSKDHPDVFTPAKRRMGAAGGNQRLSQGCANRAAAKCHSGSMA
jgi:hypothetical protein